METKHYYHVNLHWTNDRKGTLSSPALNQQIEVATPPEFPKGMPNIWSPEHLLVAAVSSCLMTTFLAVAENSKLEFSSFSCDAIGSLEQADGKYLITEVLLKPELIINSETERERAERVLAKSEAACLITNSIRSKVSLQPTILVK